MDNGRRDIQTGGVYRFKVLFKIFIKMFIKCVLNKLLFTYMIIRKRNSRDTCCFQITTFIEYKIC